MLLAVWNCISIPFTVAFEPGTNEIYDVFDRIIDICFAVDLLINFRTTYINIKTGFEVVDSKKIALSYIVGGRFFIDLLASIPFELLFSNLNKGGNSKTFKLLGLLKLIRLLRLGRIIRYMKFK